MTLVHTAPIRQHFGGTMQPTPDATGSKTAIPPRFRVQRERVLRILARWELSTRFVSNPMGPSLSPAGPR
jgi:hypothetical protein